MSTLTLPDPSLQDTATRKTDAFNFTVIGSGSSGNCSLVSDGETHLLIDAGFSCKEIFKRLESFGFDPAQLTAVLITHEHADHIQSAHTITNRLKIPFFSTAGTFDIAFREKKFFDWHEIVPGQSIQLGKMAIHPITLPHDAADPVGFRVECRDKILGHVTDFGYVSGLVEESLKGCDLLLVEANHDLDMLRDGPYPWPLKQRIASRLGHLSNEALLQLLPAILHENVQHVVLGHLSETNNNPKLLTSLMKRALKRIGLPEIPFSIAAQHQVSETYYL